MAFKKGTTIHEEKPREIIPCAFSPCSKPAICRIFTRGWINVCFDHYTTADFRRHVANSPVIDEWRKWKAEHPEREPGQDEEERNAA